MVRRDRADPAPVIDPGVDQGTELLRVAEVGRRLHVRPGAQQHACRRHGSQMLIVGRIRPIPGGGVRFGPEVLHDHLLQVSVLPGEPAQGKQRLGQFPWRLADPHEHAGGGGDRQPTGVGQRPQPHGRVLVRRPVVHRTGLREEASRRRFQHQAHAHRDRAQPLLLGPRHHSWVEMWQQAGGLEHADGRSAHIVQRRVVAALGQPLPGCRPAFLGSVAQGDEGLGTSLFRPRPR